MITEDWVTFEIAKLLRDKGFEQDTVSYPYYTDNGNLFTGDVNTPTQRYYNAASAPTLQMVLKWLREVHKIEIDKISRLSLNADDDHNYSYIIKHQYEKYHYNTYADGEFLTYEEACEAAIKYCLTNLI